MATTVRVANGKTEVLNGPYAETKEQLGGYFLIDVPDLDAAISWASRCPGASHGIVEVRPIWPNVTLERVARESYGKLVAFLAARTRDVAGAEDALSDAFAAALVDWPKNGIPKNPEGWLLTVARRRQIDAVRQRRTADGAADHLRFLSEMASSRLRVNDAIP